MKRSLIYILSILTVVAVGAAAIIIDTPTQSDLCFDSSDDSLGTFPFSRDKAEIELARDLHFILSTSTAVTKINSATFEMLKERGCITDSIIRPFFTRNINGAYEAYSNIYTVDLPVDRYSFDYDSLGRVRSCAVDHGAGSSAFRNLDVVVNNNPVAPNILGIDFLRNFKIEYNHMGRFINFHRSTIPSNYERMCAIRTCNRLSELPGTNNLYTISMNISHTEYDFVINTALCSAPIKRPKSELPASSSDLLARPEIITDIFGNSYEASVDPDVWIECGTRAGSRMVYYIDDQNQRREINPLCFFNQDVVLDFPTQSLWLRRHYIMADKTSDAR